MSDRAALIERLAGADMRLQDVSVRCGRMPAVTQISGAVRARSGDREESSMEKNAPRDGGKNRVLEPCAGVSRGVQGREEVGACSSTVIEIPMLPPRECSSNWRGHWVQRARAVRAFRETAAWATYAAIPQLGPFRADGGAPVVLDVEIGWDGRRRMVDPTNAPALLKAAIDGISDVLWCGRDEHVQLGEIRQVRGNGTTTVRLRRAA